MRRPVLCLALAALTAGSGPAAARKPGQPVWVTKETPHFRIHTHEHQRGVRPASVALAVERIHRRAKLDLGELAKAEAVKKVDLWIYPDKRSYVESSFRPPAWSVGLAVYAEYSIAVFDTGSEREMLGTIAHEHVHLLFDGYFGEKDRVAPLWLNEGLAVLAEDDFAADPANSPWGQALGELQERYFPLATYMGSNPGNDSKENRVSLWYTQAYAMSRFLLREHSRLQFANFCRQLRDGADVQTALSEAYRYRTLKDFHLAWREWLTGSQTKRQDLTRGSTWRMQEVSTKSFSTFGSFGSDFVK